MPAIIAKLLAVLGWQTLLKYVWAAVLPELKKASKKSETEFDDKMVEFADMIVQVIISDKKADLQPAKK